MTTNCEHTHPRLQPSTNTWPALSPAQTIAREWDVERENVAALACKKDGGGPCPSCVAWLQDGAPGFTEPTLFE